MEESNEEKQTEVLVEQEQKITEQIEEVGKQEFETETIEEVADEFEDDPNSMFPEMAKIFRF